MKMKEAQEEEVESTTNAIRIPIHADAHGHAYGNAIPDALSTIDEQSSCCRTGTDDGINESSSATTYANARDGWYGICTTKLCSQS